MAYRFLLEVPESLTADANVAVGAAGDAEVLVARNSHGLGFDDAYMDLTIAAQSLRVIDTLYDWFDVLGASRPDLRIVLHSGERITLEEADRAAMIAAIRHDQPWVDHSIPRIGDHVGEEFGPVERGTGGLAVAAPARPAITIHEVNHIAFRVARMDIAERFYTSFFGMEVEQRLRQSARGRLEPMAGEVDWPTAEVTGNEPQITFLANGPLRVALHNAGRGARLEMSSQLDHLSLTVDATTFARLKAEVLLRGYLLLASTETSFAFRDPFSVSWEISVHGTAPAGF